MGVKISSIPFPAVFTDLVLTEHTATEPPFCYQPGHVLIFHSLDLHERE